LKKVFQKFNINGDTMSVSSPLAPHFKLKTAMFSSTVEEREYMTYVAYARVIGSLMYAMMYRPNLSHVISMVSTRSLQ